tara:strand:+ start:601 stop:837 length:237 start_codon:yes stop_codon:yes gene_type:complete
MAYKQKGWSPFTSITDPPKNPVIYYDKGGKMIPRNKWDKLWEPSLEGITKGDLIKNWNKNPRSKNINLDKKPNIRKSK